MLENNATNVNAADIDGHTALDAVNTVSEGKLELTAFEVDRTKRKTFDALTRKLRLAVIIRDQCTFIILLSYIDF